MSLSSDVISNCDISNIIFDFHGENSYLYSSALSKTHLKIFSQRGKRTSLHHIGESSYRMDDLVGWNMVSPEIVLSIFNACARKGLAESMEVISIWYRSRHISIPIQLGTMKRAVLSEDIDTMAWCERYGCRLDDNIMYTGVSTGNVDVVRWLVDKRCSFSGQSFEKAAEIGNTKMLTQLLRRSTSSSRIGAKSIAYAASNGHMDTIKFLLAHGFTICELAPGLAAHGGQLEILEFFYERGCHIDSSVCYMAAMRGHLHILKRAREMGFPWDSLTTRVARNRKYMDVLEYAIQNGCPQE